MPTAETKLRAPHPGSTQSAMLRRRNILRFEKMYGHGFLSPGGLEALRFYSSEVQIREGMKVLVVGSGLGGDAFFLAHRFKTNVVGLDFVKDMIDISSERLAENKIPGVVFVQANIRNVQFQSERFDLVWSRDSVMYIEEKDLLFKNIYRCLKPGGQLLVTDQYKNKGPVSHSINAYLERFRYHVQDLGEYVNTLERAGFERVRHEEITDGYMHAYRSEQNEFVKTRESFLLEYEQIDYDYLMARWDEKISVCALGDLKWGLFIAYK